ncbi:helix-turn-helix domain-containing protein [Amycolatopsis pigmentata]|uniref:Helix-turn-helix domain-containing protein n=1 Tax=Amycolatopsis pigmentata TaxID=450801 RepID=A0ABW5FN02_9PSEU
MPGDLGLGTVLRELRTARKLTLAAVARRVGCAESLISYVETGNRQLYPWLAERLDSVYETGGTIAALLRGTREPVASGVTATDDLLVVQLPGGGVAVPISRRALLAGLGIGALSSAVSSPLEQAMRNVDPGSETLARFQRAFEGFQAAARVLPPSRLIDGVTGEVAVLDALRRRLTHRDQRPYTVMQARYAECLSWLCEEAGDAEGALYWTDRAAEWAQMIAWTPMVAYTFVRRSMMAISFTSDGRSAVDNAEHALYLPDAPPRVKGLAAKQMAFGYALARQRDASARALDEAMSLLSAPTREDEAALGQRSVVSDDLYTIFQTTCEIYLGRSQQPIVTLEPRLNKLAKASLRTATITRAKLARAYANAGQPADACRLTLDALESVRAVGSLSAYAELRRTLPVLDYWRSRADVREVIHAVRSAPPFSA